MQCALVWAWEHQFQHYDFILARRPRSEPQASMWTHFTRHVTNQLNLLAPRKHPLQKVNTKWPKKKLAGAFWIMKLDRSFHTSHSEYKDCPRILWSIGTDTLDHCLQMCSSCLH